MSVSHVTPPAPRPSLRSVWTRASVAWALGLCLPLAALSLHFKLVRIAQRRLDVAPLELAWLLASDVATVLAWTAVTLGALAWAEHRQARKLARVSLTALAIFYAVMLLGAHGYFMSTGSSLDWPMLAFSISHLDETIAVIGSAKSPGRVAAFASCIVAVLVLPWLFSRLAGEAERVARTSDRWLGLLHTWSVAGLLLAVGIGVRSEQGLDLTRDPLLNIALTLSSAEDKDDVEVLARAKQRPKGATRIEPTASTRKKNLVIILLESTSARSTSLYGDRTTTPFLASLGEKSVVAQRMHAVEPHTSKALATTLCGIEPRPGIGIAEAVAGGIPGKCLADLLKTQGYHTAMFQAATREFENRPQLVRNMGFDEFMSGDQMSHEGMKKANYFGYEDRILLGPLGGWIDKQSKQHDKPFFLALLTNTPHHEYLAPPHYGIESYERDVMKNRHLNSVRYDDFVLRELMGRFEKAGLDRDTIFIILGDHGEGFGEHGRYAHDDTIYQEGLHIPFLIYEPSGGRPPQRLADLHNELDVAPTVLDMLGFKIAEGGYVGRSLFAQGPARGINAACYNERKCLARLEGNLKLVHHFERQRDELFDLSTDPLEKKSIASTHKADVQRMRAAVLDWYELTRAMYRSVTMRASGDYVSRSAPDVDHPRRVRFGSSVEYLGWSSDARSIKPGGEIHVTYHFRVLERVPQGYRLFIHGWDGTRRHTWDHVPVERMYPEDDWRAGQYVSDPHRIRLPRDWKTDTLRIRGGFWKPRSPRLKAEPPTEDDDPVLVEIPVDH